MRSVVELTLNLESQGDLTKVSNNACQCLYSRVKQCVFKSLILPILLYGSETNLILCAPVLSCCYHLKGLCEVSTKIN